MKSIPLLPARLSPKRVAVLFTTAGGGIEQPCHAANDMASTAEAVTQTLRAARHTVRAVEFGRDPVAAARRLRVFAPDLVFNLAERPLDCNEKEPHAAAWLELLGLPYTGSGPLSLALAKHKAVAKQILLAHGVPTPRFEVCAAGRTRRLGFPLIVKPLTEDGSLGIAPESIVENPRQLQRRVEFLRENLGQEAIAEEFLEGREFCTAVLGNGTASEPHRVLPPGELVYHEPARWRLCSFEAKWHEEHPSYAAVEAQYPGSVDAPLRRKLERLTLACARIFQIEGYARIDFRMNGRGEPCVLEVNPNPALSPGSGLARTAQTGGLDYPGFLQEIVRLGLARGAR